MIYHNSGFVRGKPLLAELDKCAQPLVILHTEAPVPEEAHGAHPLDKRSFPNHVQ
jgi:hypothetical protein